MADPSKDQIALITEELEDLERQVEAGDLDAQTAEGLRAKYVAELNSLEQMSESLPAEATDEGVRRGGARISGRAMVGTAVVAVAITVIGVFAVNSLTGPSSAGVEGVASDVVTGDGAVDLSQISDEEMEGVVAQNPQVVGMRLALARRYFEDGDFDKALGHYMTVLDQEKHHEALANVGWMTYLSGRPDVALEYVEAALQREPSSLTAIWFLGNIQFSLGNLEEAAEALNSIIAADGIPDDVRDGAKSLLLRIEEE